MRFFFGLIFILTLMVEFVLITIKIAGVSQLSWLATFYPILGYLVICVFEIIFIVFPRNLWRAYKHRKNFDNFLQRELKRWPLLWEILIGFLISLWVTS